MWVALLTRRSSEASLGSIWITWKMERKLMGGRKMAVAYDPTKQYDLKVWDVAYRHAPVRPLMARIY
jgi:hypothetical protein